MLLISKKTLYRNLLGGVLSLSAVASALADPASDAVAQVAAALGGADRLEQLHNQVVSARFTGYAPLEAPTPGGTPEKIDGVNYQMTLALDGSRYRTQWQLAIDFPLQASYDFSEIINGDHGAVLGVDNLLQVPQAPMQAIRLAARKMEYLVTSPVEIVKAMLAAPATVTLHGSRETRKQNVSVLGLRKYGREILLWVDNASHLPLQATYWDANPSYGDMEITTRYADWLPADGIMQPMRIEQVNRDQLLVHIEVQTVNFNVTFIRDPFAVPAELSVPLDEKLFNIGLKYSNWFHRFLLVGIPFDLDQFAPESVFLQPVGQGVFYLRGYTHHSLIVEMADYLLLFDPVLLEERTQAVLPVIKRQWPNKKIRYVIPTHFHVDHSAGVRGYVADGASLVSTQADRKFYRDVLDARHVVYPDLLSLLDADARLLTIADGADYVFDDGQRRVRLLQIDNRHAPGLIVPYIEDEKMLFVSDLFSPGLFSAPLPPQFSFWALDLYNDLLTRGLDIRTLVGAHGGVGSYQEFLDAVRATFALAP